jgi:hypothetical protein
MAAATGVSLRSVRPISAAHRLQPHRVRHFKLSQDPALASKLRDVVEALSRPTRPQPCSVGRLEDEDGVDQLARRHDGFDPIEEADESLGGGGAPCDNYAAHKDPRWVPGSPGNCAGCSISRPPPAPEPMRLRPFFATLTRRRLVDSGLSTPYCRCSAIKKGRRERPLSCIVQTADCVEPPFC